MPPLCMLPPPIFDELASFKESLSSPPKASFAISF
jgi:hypothetical protein